LSNLEEKEKWEKQIKLVRGDSFFDDLYTKGKELGEGKFGKVYEAKCIKTGNTYAVKVIKKSKATDELEWLRKEIETMKIFTDDNITRLYGVFDDKDLI
jgi:serine/threonine protein kinase